jgi:hypothetical protein
MKLCTLTPKICWYYHLLLHCATTTAVEMAEPRYYNCRRDGCTSPGNHGYPLVHGYTRNIQLLNSKSHDFSLRAAQNPEFQVTFRNPCSMGPEQQVDRDRKPPPTHIIWLQLVALSSSLIARLSLVIKAPHSNEAENGYSDKCNYLKPASELQLRLVRVSRWKEILWLRTECLICGWINFNVTFDFTTFQSCSTSSISYTSFLWRNYS